MRDEASCPLTRQEVVERYFLEHRAKLIDLAAFLDRVDRAMPDDTRRPEDDFRLAAFRRAITILQDDRPGRARRVLDFFSDPTTDPIASAADLKGAFGAYPGGPSGRSRR